MTTHTTWAGCLNPTNPLKIADQEIIGSWYHDVPDETELESNSPWAFDEDGDLVCESGDGFFTNADNALPWLRWLIQRYFLDNPLNGEVEWEADQWGQRGAIKVTNNEIQVGYYQLTFNPVEPYKIAEIIHGGRCADAEDDRDSVTGLPTARHYCCGDCLTKAENIITYLSGE